MSLPNLIEVQATDTPQQVADKIALSFNAIFLLLGNFDGITDPSVAARVRSLFARALIPVAKMANALIVDDGAGDGLAAQMGQAAAQMDDVPPLLGILASDAAKYDTNHPQIVKMPAEWTDSATSRLNIVAGLAKGGATGEKPVIVLLCGGGDIEKAALLRCARRQWPIVILQGVGGLSDSIVNIVNQPDDATGDIGKTDPDLREILDTASPLPLSLDDHVDDQARVLSAPIQLPGDVLADAWCRYDDLDVAAVEKQKQFQRLQRWILRLAVLAALLAVLISQSALPVGFRSWLSSTFLIPKWNGYGILHIFMVLVPIAISILSGFSSRFREGNKWILYRAAAEATKREIFRYRMRSGAYSAVQCGKLSAQSKLSAKLTDITSNLTQSEVNKSSLPLRPDEKYEKTNKKKKPKEPTQAEIEAAKTCSQRYASEVKLLTAEEYLVNRIDNQIKYLVNKVATLYKQLKFLERWVLLVGGAGTFLAAIRMDVWVALTTAIATAVTTKLQTDQVDNSIVQYNIALTNLRNIESWWKGLSPWEKTRRRNIDLLVDQTETTLERETAGWIQQMQSELDKLTEKQAAQDQKAQDGKKK